MISIPISIGELLDKLSILHIKKDKIQDSDKVKKVKIEYELLYTISEPFLGIKEFFNLYDDLIKTNSELWEIEDKLRIFEKQKVDKKTWFLDTETAIINEFEKKEKKKKVK